MNNHIQLREFIETIIKLHEERRDDLRLEDDRRLKEKFESLDTALRLQAASYPTVQDFNNLKTHVDVELATRSGSSSSMTTLFQVLTLLSLSISALLAYLTYVK